MCCSKQGKPWSLAASPRKFILSVCECLLSEKNQFCPAEFAPLHSENEVSEGYREVRVSFTPDYMPTLFLFMCVVVLYTRL